MVILQDFLRVLSFFRPISKHSAKNKNNTKRDKLLFSFKMYDLDGDGEISVVSLRKSRSRSRRKRKSRSRNRSRV